MSSQNGPSWDTPAVAARVEALLGQMTLEEKVAFVTGDLNFDYGFYSAPLERLDIPALTMADGPAGVRINRGDVHGGAATSLPAPIALAATWDPALARRYGDVIGAECFVTGHNVSLGPAVDIARVPTGGRTFESFGEDPRLTAAIGAEVVRGIQSYPVQACVKHYAINNQEYQRATIDSVIDERSMMELYLPPFEALVDAGVASAMASFNKVNGAYATENRTLLTDILRERFGFRGWVMSDYGATHSTAPAANAGLDQEQPAAGHWGDHLREAVEAGEVAESVLDDKVRNILRPLIGLGQLERRPTIEEFDVAGHDATAREIAAAGMVLLRNRGVLPLDPATVGSVIVIGSDVDSAGAQGGGSSLVRPTSTSSPVQGIAARLGGEVAWTHGADPVTPGALLPGPAPVPSSLLSDGDGSPGLRAQYWTNAGFDGDPFLERTDPQVDVNLGFFNFPGFNAASPRMPQLPAELNGQTSARWTGVLTVPETGVYGLSVTALGWFSLTLDESVVIHSGGEADAAVINAPDPTYPYGQLTLQGATAEPEVHTIECELEAGRDYHLRLEYSANSAEQGFLTGAQVRLGWVPPEGVVDPAVQAAAARAAEADVAIVVVRDYESEQADRPHLVLPGAQEALVRAVAAANPRTVVVVMTGAPTDMGGWDDAAAIVQAWYPGQAQGAALADVLFGDVDPGGRLPLTLPVVSPITDEASYPGVGGRVVYPEGVFVGYRGLGSTDVDPPLFPFGHGLSYTTFDYSDLEVRPGAGDVAGVASVTVTNTGDRAGSDVVQAYVGELSAPVPTPLRQLAAFAKVRLRPGESTRVELPIPVRAVSYWDVETHEWARVTGDVDVSIGASSRDIRASAPLTVDVARSTPDRQPVR